MRGNRPPAGEVSAVARRDALPDKRSMKWGLHLGQTRRALGMGIPFIEVVWRAPQQSAPSSECVRRWQVQSPVLPCRRRNTQPQVPGKGQFSGRRFRTVNLPWKSATARRGHICGARMIKQTCLAVQTGRQLNDSPDDQQQTRIGRFKFNERPFENSSLMRGKGHHGRTVRRQTWTSK